MARLIALVIGAGLLLGTVMTALVLASVVVRLRAPRVVSATPDFGTAHMALGTQTVPFEVQVSQLDRAAKPGPSAQPAAGDHLVTMEVTFENHSKEDQRADPHDFRLIDSAGRLQQPAFGTGPSCAAWKPVSLPPGAQVGPEPLCFQTSGNPNGKLALVWTPDVAISFLWSPVQIPLQ